MIKSVVVATTTKTVTTATAAVTTTVRTTSRTALSAPQKSSSFTNCFWKHGSSNNNTTTTKTNTTLRILNSNNNNKRYITSDDYNKVGASVPSSGFSGFGSSGGTSKVITNQHGSQFIILSFPLFVITGYFVLFPSNKEQLEEAIREKYEHELGEVSTDTNTGDLLDGPNSKKAAEREKNFELFYKHTIKNMGNTTNSNSSSTRNNNNTIPLTDTERKNVIEMEQRLQSVLLGGKENATLNANLVTNNDRNNNSGNNTSTTIVIGEPVAKSALIDDGQSRNPYSKAIKKQQQQKLHKNKKQQLGDATDETTAETRIIAETTSSKGRITGPLTVGIVAIGTIAFALVTGGGR
jgi:hypothetical protein